MALRNRAVLVSVEHFDPGVGLGRRPGASRDAKTLHRTLSQLGFKVDLHTDYSRDQIYELFLTGESRPPAVRPPVCVRSPGIKTQTSLDYTVWL